MTIDQTLAEVLDETIKALTSLDPAKLQALEQRIVSLAKSNVKCDRDHIRLVLLKKNQIEIIRQSFQVSLDALTRLHARNMRNQWAQ
jgi:septum formation topological specificity factor MinE